MVLGTPCLEDIPLQLTSSGLSFRGSCWVDCGTNSCACVLPACRLAEPPLQQLVPQLTTAEAGAAALLIQVKGNTKQELADTIRKAQEVLSGSGAKFGGQPDKPLGVESYPFSTDPRVRHSITTGLQICLVFGHSKGTCSLSCPYHVCCAGLVAPIWCILVVAAAVPTGAHATVPTGTQPS
jgi:hypothetical protein